MKGGKRRNVPERTFANSGREKFERLERQVAVLQDLSDRSLLTDDQLQMFFARMSAVQAAALEAARAQAMEVGRTLTGPEIEAVSIGSFADAAGDVAREIWGADVGALMDGRRPQ